MTEMGKCLVLAGIVLVVIGLLAQAGVFGWFGRLPGDIRIERPNGSFYFPIVSMLVVSVLLSLLVSLARRFF
jgi:membrane protein implicated in regulation of membrane protease activity